MFRSLFLSMLIGASAPRSVTVALAQGDQVAVFSGGCFWGIQAVFQHVKGVTNAVSGYAGGDASNARYDRVSSGTTGHAESVRVTFDPAVVSYEQLLHVFFAVAHDPTQLNYQGPDHGPQYRSAIWYSNDQQKVAAEESRLAAIADVEASEGAVGALVNNAGFRLGGPVEEVSLDECTASSRRTCSA